MWSFDDSSVIPVVFSVDGCACLRFPTYHRFRRHIPHFPDEGQPRDQRLIPSGNWDRLADCMEEFIKYTIVMRPHIGLFADRFSEREEKKLKEEKMHSYVVNVKTCT